MQKTLLIFLVMFILKVQPSIAQPHKFEVGVEGGPNVSYPIIINTTRQYNKKAGFRYFGGIAIQYNFNKSLALKTGISFEHRSYDMNYHISGYNSLGKYLSFNKHSARNQYYFTLPVLVKMGATVKRTFFYACMGPYISVTTYPSIDAGLIMGVGTSVMLSRSIALTIEPRSSIGFLNNSGFTEYTMDGVTSILVGVSYKFGERKTEVK